MKLHHKLQVLIANYQARGIQIQFKITQGINHEYRLNDEIDELKRQENALKKIIKFYGYDNTVDRATLFEEIRKVAVLRRQLTLLNQQMLQKMKDFEENNLELQKNRRELLCINNKTEKYSYLHKKIKVADRIRINHQGEIEMEELFSWKK